MKACNIVWDENVSYRPKEAQLPYWIEDEEGASDYIADNFGSRPKSFDLAEDDEPQEIREFAISGIVSVPLEAVLESLYDVEDDAPTEEQWRACAMQLFSAGMIDWVADECTPIGNRGENAEIKAQRKQAAFEQAASVDPEDLDDEESEEIRRFTFFVVIPVSKMEVMEFMEYRITDDDYEPAEWEWRECAIALFRDGEVECDDNDFVPIAN